MAIPLRTPMAALGFALAVSACAGDSSTSLTPSFDEAAPAAETLAGPAAEPSDEIICPDKYVVFPKPWPPGTPPDDNGNGVVCWDGRDTRSLVDDIVKDDGGGNGLATGHGNFFDRRQDISFSFHGKQTGRRGEAKGEFEYHDQTPAGPDLTVHGDVTCLTLIKNQATFLGVVTRSNDPGLPVGIQVAWVSVDNGEGANAHADLVSRPSFAGKGEVPCDKILKPLPLQPIVSGNIQVH